MRTVHLWYGVCVACMVLLDSTFHPSSPLPSLPRPPPPPPQPPSTTPPPPSQMALSLAGKRAVVFGGSSGIGLAVVHMLCARGASVKVISRDPEVCCGPCLFSCPPSIGARTAFVSTHQLRRGRLPEPLPAIFLFFLSPKLPPRGRCIVPTPPVHSSCTHPPSHLNLRASTESSRQVR
jgi:hypothetical protein